ncbi:MAG: hypothetical protein VB858_16205 [Planctomycetaceae bacterium]
MTDSTMSFPPGKESAVSTQPQRTFILIGASNVAFNLPDIWRGLTTDQPTRLIVAAGHGRSFGRPSTVLGRTLPGITECSLWKALPEISNGQSARVLMTDIGNDLLYGADPETIAGWVQKCADRLLDSGSQLALATLPVEMIRRLSRTKFYLFRRILFPDSKLAFEDLCELVAELVQRIENITASRGIRLLKPDMAWYGFDPIHFRRRKRSVAWTKYLSALDESARARNCSVLRGIRIWRCQPAVRNRRGRRLETSQPVLNHAGSELWLF